ncbi:hypothetical protein BT63DRAFT_469219 [Microthyrium microscopicum]|uniref:Uncharacterized protein n=1 Tax=Microthyrium microscopicum TaxID=703497 RepID=A0A6A6UGU7_9PEZI|nr:hypothetical protein BT63DRAFT_469219 [Microthyrium microscopicum]
MALTYLKGCFTPNAWTWLYPRLWARYGTNGMPLHDIVLEHYRCWDGDKGVEMLHSTAFKTTKDFIDYLRHLDIFSDRHVNALDIRIHKYWISILGPGIANNSIHKISQLKFSRVGFDAGQPLCRVYSDIDRFKIFTKPAKWVKHELRLVSSFSNIEQIELKGPTLNEAWEASDEIKKHLTPSSFPENITGGRAQVYHGSRCLLRRRIDLAAGECNELSTRRAFHTCFHPARSYL